MKDKPDYLNENVAAITKRVSRALPVPPQVQEGLKLCLISEEFVREE